MTPAGSDAAQATEAGDTANAGLQVLLVDDHPAIRAGIRIQLEEQGLLVVGEAGDGAEALELIRRTTPTVVLADLRMPGVDGLQLIELARGERLDVAFVLLSAATEAHLVQRALDLGARGYVGKDATIDTIVSAIRVCGSGGRYVDPMLIASVMAPASDGLTDRELEILQHAANGKQNKVIAHELGIGEETVKTHLSSVMRKLDAVSRTEAVAEGIRRALIL